MGKDCSKGMDEMMVQEWGEGWLVGSVPNGNGFITWSRFGQRFGVKMV